MQHFFLGNLHETISSTLKKVADAKKKKEKKYPSEEFSLTRKIYKKKDK